MIRNTVVLAMVSGVYYWRARTEERHLSADPGLSRLCRMDGAQRPGPAPDQPAQAALGPPATGRRTDAVPGRR